MKSVKMFLGLLVCLFLLASQAQAVLLDFENLDSYDNSVVDYGLAQNPTVTFSESWDYGLSQDKNGYIAEYSFFDETPATIIFGSAVNNLSFDYKSTAPQSSVTVNALDSFGEIIGSQNLFQTGFKNTSFMNLLFSFDNIFGLSFVIDEDMAGAIQVDNINYTPVPVPGAALLLGSALLGLVGFRRTRTA